MEKHILVVDDSSSIRKSVEFLLQQSGYKVTLAEDGAVGLSKCETGKYDLVITDVNMPNMDGITMIEKVRALTSFKFVPILILSTENQSHMLDRGKKAGATGWIVKPFTNEKLLATIKKVLR